MLFEYSDFEDDSTDFLCPADEDFKIAGYAEDEEILPPAYELSEILDPPEEYAMIRKPNGKPPLRNTFVFSLSPMTSDDSARAVLSPIPGGPDRSTCLETERQQYQRLHGTVPVFAGGVGRKAQSHRII